MPPVGRGAFALGFAGLLPQLLAVALIVVGRRSGEIGDLIILGIGRTLAFGYAALILSFLGGMWWGFAMRREAGQGRLATLAVVPSLVALAIAIAASIVGLLHWGLIALGSAILLTLPVDRRLVRTGDAPPNWMRLRVPLSAGLGVLTVAAGAASGL